MVNIEINNANGRAGRKFPVKMSRLGASRKGICQGARQDRASCGRTWLVEKSA